MNLITTLHFQKLRYKNLLSTGSEFTEILLDQDKMTLIVGPNGEGKSTIIDALCFVLFKKPFRKVTLAQLVNSITKKELLIELEFICRGHQYLIRRGIKPNIFEVYCEGELLNQPGAVRDYQEDLEKHILRTNFDTFCQIVILGSANYIPFMQLPAKKRREVVEDLYDLRIFTSMNSVLKDRIKLVDKTINDLEKEKLKIMSNLELSQKHQTAVSEDKQSWILDKQKAIELALSQIAALDDELEECENKIEEMKPVLKTYETLEKKMSSLDTLKHKIEINRSSIAKEIQFLEENCDCPTCKQVIDPKFKTTVISEKSAKIAEIDEGYKMLLEKIAFHKAELNETSSKKQGLRQIENQRLVNASHMDNQKLLIRKLEAEIQRLEDEQEKVIDEHELTELESALLEAKREWAALTRQGEMMGRLAVLLKDNGVKSLIIKKYSGTFNQLVNSYLAKLEFYVDFHLDENFEETIKSRGRDTFTYNSFSEGEKLRIDLAVMFAWREIATMRASLNCNLLIMDEVLDSSLDSSGMTEMLKIVQKLSERWNSFIISHRGDQITEAFGKTLTFRKTRGFSKLVV